MLIDSLIQKKPVIPPATQELITLLSGGKLSEKVYCLTKIDQVTEFILSNIDRIQPTTKITNSAQEKTIDSWQIQDAIALITKPYLEKEGKVNLTLIQDSLYIYDNEGVCLSFVKPKQIAQQLILPSLKSPLIAIDAVHAGTSIPDVVKELINPKIVTDKPIYQAHPYTAIRQSDVGVKELIAYLWRTKTPKYTPVMGTAFLWNLIICNGNRPLPTTEETTIEYLQNKQVDCWLNTQTYRGDFIYQNNQLPPWEIRNKILENHCFSLKVTGAVRGALSRLSATQPIIIEPHSYAGFGHGFLNKYLTQADDNQNWLEIAQQENSLRPLVSVLDVRNTDDEDGYWTTTPEEADIFYQAFLAVLKQNKDKLPPIENIPEFENDVYGYGGGILTRLTQVVQFASIYADVDQMIMTDFYQRNIFTVEIDRLLVQLSEFEDVSTITEDIYHDRCEIVGSALTEGIEAILPLMSARLNK